MNRIFKISLLCSLVPLPSHLLPALVILQSELPPNTIEDPNDWAWGLHPDNGLGYKARNDLTVEVCLDNPQMINTALCNLPLDICLDNPEYIADLGCAGNKYDAQTCVKYPQLLLEPPCEGNKYDAKTCVEYPQLLLEPQCEDNQYPAEICIEYPELLESPSCEGVCAKNPEITTNPACAGQLEGYKPSIIECKKNKGLCSLGLCDEFSALKLCD